MGVSRRSIVFGRGKRVPSEDDCAENTLRIINPSSIREKQTDSPNISPTRTLNVSESGGEDDSRDNNAQIESIDALPSDPKKSVTKRRAGTFWNSEEAMTFYDGVKEHGKNFEKIVLTLNRKKLTKDKDQVRNFFYNLWKIYREKAGIAENEWDHICQSAKELLVVINALEWRKRTHSTNVNSIKFKTLIMTGFATSKMAGRRIPISIKTPNCNALHRYFPSLKQSAKMPSTMQIQLAPNSYSTKRYVLSCEQNPLLTMAVNTQSSVSTLFRFLEQKWQKFSNLEPKPLNEQQSPTAVLYPPESFKPSKILIQPAIDSHPSVKSFPSSSTKSDQLESTKIPSNVFEILEEQLINGLTAENVSNTSFIHLYYLFNQQSTIRLRYDVLTNVRSSNVFIKLSELIRNTEGIDNVKPKKKPNVIPEFTAPQPSNVAAIKRLPNFRMANIEESGTTCVVDNERERFKQQLVALRQNSKDPKKIGKTVGKSANKRMCMSEVASPQTEPLAVLTQDSSLELSLDSFGLPHFRRKTATSVQNGKTFTNLQSITQTSQEQPSTSANVNVFEDVANNELTRSSLLPSPSKSLQDDAYRYFESMASQTSNDIFANFSGLINSVNNESSQSALE